MLAQVQAASTQTGLLSSTPQSCSSFSLKKAGLYEWQNQAQPFSVCCGRVSGYSRPWLGVDRDSSRRAGPLPPSHFTEEVKPCLGPSELRVWLQHRCGSSSLPPASPRQNGGPHTQSCRQHVESDVQSMFCSPSLMPGIGLCLSRTKGHR